MPYHRTTYDDVAASDASDRRRFDDLDSPPYDIAARDWPRPADVAAQLADDWRHEYRTRDLDPDGEFAWWDDRTDDWWVA